MLDGLKCYVMKKNGIFSTSTQILESVYVPGYTIKGMSEVDIKAIEKHFWISKILYWLEKINILLNLKVRLIHRKHVPLLHTQY